MDAGLNTRPARVGVPGLLMSFAGIILLALLFFALLGGLALGIDALLHGREHVFDLLVTARDAARKGEQRTLETTGIALGSLIYVAAIAAMLVVARLRRGLHWREPIAWNAFRTSRSYWVLVLLGIAWGLGASVLVEYLHPAARDWFSLPKAPVAVISSFLLVVVLAPVAEELFFRGWLYTGLRQSFGFPLALGVSAILFALAHWERTHLYAAAILPVGFALGYAREMTGSTRASALFHGLYNLTGWVLTYLAIG
jgi:membrane protease YdiL (CAAX protease family)